MRLEEVPRDPLTNRVIRQIKDLIWRGEVTPGEYLPPQPVLPRNSVSAFQLSARPSRRSP